MNNSDYDSVWLQLCSELRVKLPEEHINEWETSFKLISSEKNKVVIGFYDRTIMQFFKDNYLIEISNAANIATGSLVTVKFKMITRAPEVSTFAGGSAYSAVKKISIKNILAALVCIFLAVCILFVGYNFVRDFSFTERFYTVNCRKVYNDFRIIQISDLHETSYGAGNEKLISRIEKLNPDIIVFTGDIVENLNPSESTMALLKACAEITDSYFVYGNREEELAFNCDMTKDSLDAKFDKNLKKLVAADAGLKKTIESTGVKVLNNEIATLQINGNTIDIFGCLNANPSAFWDYAGVNFTKFIYDNPSNFKLFVTHEPYILETEEDFGDAALAGHTHGGVVNLPFVGSVYEKTYGFFPEKNGHEVKGKFSTGTKDTKTIISTGLSNKGMIRISNQPELVVIDVNGH